MKNDDIETMRKHCDDLKLGDKITVTFQDVVRLVDSLKFASEYGLADYVARLGNVEEFEDLLVNVIYSDED